uniref:Uncharacterized protein n=1 Tax=Anopheles farauti TaxID=69004 RepID=A0A182QV33_9DIPT
MLLSFGEVSQYGQSLSSEPSVAREIHGSGGFRMLGRGGAEGSEIHFGVVAMLPLVPFSGFGSGRPYTTLLATDTPSSRDDVKNWAHAGSYTTCDTPSAVGHGSQKTGGRIGNRVRLSLLWCGGIICGSTSRGQAAAPNRGALHHRLELLLLVRGQLQARNLFRSLGPSLCMALILVFLGIGITRRCCFVLTVKTRSEAPK